MQDWTIDQYSGSEKIPLEEYLSKKENYSEVQKLEDGTIKGIYKGLEFEIGPNNSVTTNNKNDEDVINYYKVTLALSEGISIDNNIAEVEENKSYIAKIIVQEGYMLDELTVTMGGEQITVDKTTKIINIEKVIANIEITANATNNINKETIIDYWPLTSNLNNRIQGRDNMEVTEGTISFNDGMYLDGNSTVETINNYILPDGEFSILLQIKDIEFTGTRYSWILNIGNAGASYHEKNDFGFFYDNYYPNLVFQGTNDLWSATTNGEGVLPSDGNWHTLLGICNGSRVIMYYDFQKVGRPTMNTGSITRDLSSKMAIGRSNSSISKLKGYFKNLVVINRELTEEEISQMSNE